MCNHASAPPRARLAATGHRVLEAVRRPRVLRIAVLGGLLVALYGSVLRDLVGQWSSDPDYGHGFLVPLFSGYVLWRERVRFLRMGAAPNRLGAVWMLAATGLLVAGTLGAEYFTARLSFVCMVAGLVLLLAGWAVLRAALFPIGFLAAAIPIPVLLQNQITFPLQLLASRLAAGSLEAIGIPVVREGNILQLSRTSLEVAEACSGLRSLTALLALALVFGYLARSRPWVRMALVALIPPIAVLANSLRVVATGLLVQAYGPQWTEGARHEISGLLVFVAALLGLAAAHWLLTTGERRWRHGHA